MEIFAELIDSLIKSSPVIGILLIGIWYLFKENKSLKVDNKELNIYIRDQSSKNVKVLESVSNTLDKLVDQTDDNIDSLKEWLDLKLRERK